MMNAVVPIRPAENVDAYRASTDAAAICKEIVVATASMIQGRKYVAVEGWQAIAIAHGCAASARDVEKVDGGVRAIGEIRRMSDGAVISTAEGFVGEDEETWYGGTNKYGKVLPKRADYAIRAMAQTRAISRAGRSAFAHVVVMMNAGLATTPAEEVPAGGFNDDGAAVVNQQPAREAPVDRITEAQRQTLMDLSVAVGVDSPTLCAKCKVQSLPELPASKFSAVKAWLESKRPAPAASDILEDEVPY